MGERGLLAVVDSSAITPNISAYAGGVMLVIAIGAKLGSLAN